VEDLLDEIEDLQGRLSSKNNQLRDLYPASFCFIPTSTPLISAPDLSRRVSKRSSKRRLNFNQLEGLLLFFQIIFFIFLPPGGVPIQVSSAISIQPGTPGMVSLDDGGNLILLPFEGLFCNVPEHHQMEDDLSSQQEELKQKNQIIRMTTKKLEDLEKLLGPIEEAEDKMEKMKMLIKAHEDTILNLREEQKRVKSEKSVLGHK